MLRDDPIDGEHGDAEELHLLRLRALLHEMVRDGSRTEAARELGLDPRTVGACMDGGPMSWRVREALERKLLNGGRPAADRQREHGEELERRVEALERDMQDGVEALEKGMGALRDEHARALRKVERRLEKVEALSGFRDPSSPPDARENKESGALPRRRYPDVVTVNPEPGDEDVYGAAWPLVDEWRRLRDNHPNRGGDLTWLTVEERIRELEVAMLEEYGLTLPPETEPLRGLWRSSQLNWRRMALRDVRRARSRRELLRWVRRALTLGLWWN